MNPRFGRLEPHHFEHVEAYPITRLGISAQLPLEKRFEFPSWVCTWYDQGETNGCTGFSASLLMTHYNKFRYDGGWLYRRGTEVDNDPFTSPEADIGTYLYAVMDVLRNEGPRRVVIKNFLGLSIFKYLDFSVLLDGVRSYYWCTNLAEIRTAFETDNPVLFGIPWYSNFMYPEKIDGEYFIGRESYIGSALGGHAIVGSGISDQREAAALRNTWGKDYPEEVWLPYPKIERLMNEGGECCVVIDRPERKGRREEHRR